MLTKKSGSKWKKKNFYTFLGLNCFFFFFISKMDFLRTVFLVRRENYDLDFNWVKFLNPLLGKLNLDAFKTRIVHVNKKRNKIFEFRLKRRVQTTHDIAVIKFVIRLRQKLWAFDSSTVRRNQIKSVHTLLIIQPLDPPFEGPTGPWLNMDVHFPFLSISLSFFFSNFHLFTVNTPYRKLYFRSSQFLIGDARGKNSGIEEEGGGERKRERKTNRRFYLSDFIVILKIEF